MYYVYAAINIIPKLNSMIPSKSTFLKLSPGTYYYDATAKNYGWLLHKDLNGNYRLLVNTSSFLVEKQSKITESCLKLDEDILDCEEYNLKNIQSHINATHSFHVPQNAHLIVVGEKGMQDIIGKDSFENLSNRFNEEQSDDIEELLEYLTSLHK
eukprot:gb/GECH01001049.1/.p1 GENE.gb/GECH01001049.1/~~gb/GECH01001049.1/.p1  ORF type:complete len:155 (+),score=10.23 gb/GECH01001049.1/:1-465(+)